MKFLRDDIRDDFSPIELRPWSATRKQVDGPAAERDSLEEIGGIGSPLQVAHGANAEEREDTI